MKRPYVICHILSSLDGKINGPFMGTEAAAGLSQEYGTLRSQMKGDAWLYGTTTTKEFTGFARPVLEEKIQAPQGDFVADDQAEMYYISLDTEGEVGWESGTCHRWKQRLCFPVYPDAFYEKRKSCRIYPEQS